MKKEFKVGLLLGFFIPLLLLFLFFIIAYFYLPGPIDGFESLEAVRNLACRELVQENNCGVNTNIITISNFDANNDGDNNPGITFDWTAAAADQCGDVATSEDNLASLAACQYGRTTEAQTKILCGCP